MTTPATRYYTPPIPNGWFQVAFSDEVKPGEVKPLKYFGKDLVIFRTEAGKVTVLDAFCPHLGAHLGYGGKVEGDGVVCPFHAWKFGAEGELLDVPYAKRKPAKAKLGCWPVKEMSGLVMVWHHALGHAPEWDIPDAFPEYGNDAWTEYVTHETTIATTNQEMAENQVDSAHFHYVHGATNMPHSEGEADGHIMRVSSPTGMVTPMGPVEGRVQSTAWGFGLATIRFTGIVETFLVATTTPIDDGHVHVRFNFQVKKVGGGDVTRGVGKAFMKEIVKQLEEDRPIWEHKIQHANPVLCDGDGPIGLFRRWTHQFYSWPEEQQAAE